MAHAVKMFGAFQRRIPGATSPGIGVGLATVARIIKWHDGRVWADAAPGAILFFTL